MSPASTAAALSLGRRVVRVLTTARSLDEAATGVLREVAEPFGWCAGVLWLLDPRTGLLRAEADWAADDGLAELRRAMRRVTFAPGVGVPGEVFESLSPRWVTDLDRARLARDDAELPRGPAMLAAGVRSVIAVPVVSGEGPAGVMEFFTTAPEPESAERRDAITVVGQQIAEYLVRVRVEQRLRASEASSASIVRAALDCIIAMDHRGRIVDLNPAAEAVFGYRRDDAIGERLADLIIPPHLREAHQRALRRYAETGQPTILNRRLELEGMRADGTTFPVELTVTRLGTGDPPTFAGFIRDITERRDADEQRTRLLETLQQTLLPPHLPAVPRLELGAAYRAGSEGVQVGGDFYDVFELGEGRWALVLGDVSGKGVEAAVLTATLRHATRAAAVRHREPRDVMAALNDAMLRDTEGGAFCTAVYGTIDLGGDHVRVCLASAGHPLPLLVDDGQVRPLGRPGTLLGAFPATVAHQHQVALRPGQLLVLYTDGVVEARTPTGLFGFERLEAVLADRRGTGAPEVAARIESAVLAATRGQVSDDLAVLTVRALS
ncbi:MAG: SpoIIE family protein phosphatase [Actinomycetota bacterium]|nr:SpoIIE family protein phosphatase [Actinomycetota bacterium]